MIVVAAVIEDEAGRVLLAQRPEGKQHGGLWEFPGGKIEPGERPYDALRRELMEELGIDVGAAVRFMRVRRQHASGPLALEIWRVLGFTGSAEAHEHAAIRWCTPDEALMLPLCDADIPVARTLMLPNCYAITPEPEVSRIPDFLARVEAGLARGNRLVQWRAPNLDAATYREVALRLRALTQACGARLLLNATLELAVELGTDGVHLSSARLRRLCSRPEVPAGFLIAASCHDREELALAETIAADFVVISPIVPTPSHPGAPAIGWFGFQGLLESTDLPAYALGGLAPDDGATARAHGAIGVAGISAFW